MSSLAPPESSSAPTPATPAAKGPRTWSAGTLTYTSGGLVVLFLWLLWGDFSWAMRDRSVGPMAQWYLQHLEVPNLVFALLITSFPALVSLLLGPVISYKSDRHRGPRGRRIPFLLVTTPIAAFGMAGIALCPVLGPWLHTALGGVSPGEKFSTLICFGVFWAAFEFATIAATAVFGGLINDVVPQPLLGRFYGLFRAVSLIDGMIFNFWLIGKLDTHFTVILLSVAAFYGAAFMWVCFRVKEGSYPPPPPPEPGSPGPLGGFLRGARTYLRESFSHPYYLAVFALITVAALGFMPVNTFMIPYAKSLGMSMDTYGKCLSLTFAISLVLAYPLGWLADLFHPLRMSLACVAGYLAVTAWGALCARTPETFAVALVLHGVLSGCYYTCAASLTLRLFPRARFAQFASAAGVLTSLTNMAIGPAVGGIVDFTGDLYHHTFTIGCAIAATALALGLHVHRAFMRHGGPRAYVAPTTAS